jgi:hypothetical protein
VVGDTELAGVVGEAGFFVLVFWWAAGAGEVAWLAAGAPWSAVVGGLTST